MKNFFGHAARKTRRALVALLLLALFPASAGHIVQVFYENLPGDKVADLRNSPNFLSATNLDGSPVRTSIRRDFFQGESDPLAPRTHYGSVMRGILEAPQTGLYTLYLASDGESELWLSGNADPTGKQLVAAHRGSVEPQEWFKKPEQSVQVDMIRGGKYYVELLYKKGGPTHNSSDHVAVGWKFPEGTTREPDPWVEFPIRALHLAPYVKPGSPLRILEEPQDVALRDGEKLTLSVTAEMADPSRFSYQWYRLRPRADASNPLFEPILDEPGIFFGPPTGRQAHLSYYTDYYTYNANNGVNSKMFSAYYVVLTNSSTVVTSRTALVYFSEPDITGPKVADVSVLEESPEVVEVTFDEAISPGTATNLANYQLTGGLQIRAVKIPYHDDNYVDLHHRRIIHLTASGPLLEDTLYQLTLNNIQDTATAPQNGELGPFDVEGNRIDARVPATRLGNTIATNTVVNVTRAQGLIQRSLFLNVPGNTLADLTNSSDFPEHPTRDDWRRSFETPLKSGVHYGEKLHGYVVPPTAGDYTFYLSSGGPSELWLSTDSNPSNKRKIAFEPKGQPGFRNWTGTENRHAASPENQSTPVPLQAGKHYYVEVIHKGGSTTNHLSVNWRLPTAAIPPIGSAPIAGRRLSTKSPSGPIALTGLSQSEFRQGEDFVIEAAARGNPPYHYQWYRRGLDLTPIPGATERRLKLGKADSSMNGTYVLAVNNYFSDFVSEDITAYVHQPLRIVSAGSLGGLSVDVRFSELLNPTAATDVRNYQLNPGRSIRSIRMHPDGKSVKLILDNPLGGPFVLSVTNLLSQIGDPLLAPFSLSSAVTLLVSGDLGTAGDPQQVGTSYQLDHQSIDTMAGGSGLGDVSDALHFVSATLTGDFDLKARLESLEAPTDSAVACLMARGSQSPDSGYLTVGVSPNRVNEVERDANYFTSMRPFAGSPSSAEPWPEAATFEAAYPPRAWMRLQRKGSLFTAYRSLDGLEWIELGRMTVLNAPMALEVGLATSAGNNGGTQGAMARYRDIQGLFAPLTNTPVALEIQRRGDQVFLRWPTGWSLQKRETLGAENSWIESGETPAANEGFLELLVAPNRRERFYRLVK